MEYAPIIIGTYSRIEHLKRCVESLKKNRLAKKTILIIGIDYPIKDSHKLDNDSIKEYCKDIIGFEKVIIKEWDCNLGARENFAKLRDIAFEFSETVIITEDDNVFHPGFLEYMNTNLSNYEDDNRIFAICGYNYPVTYSEEDGNEIDQLVLKSYSAWGVGVWKNKYKQVDFSSQAYVDILKSPLKIYDVNKNVGDHILLHYLDAISNNKVYGDTWISLHIYKNNQFCIFPMISLVKNIGNDGTGLNCGIDEKISYQKVLRDNQNINYTKLKVFEIKRYRELLNQYFKTSFKCKIKFTFDLIKYIYLGLK
ncbi:glycosyltransferase family 2 protein [Photobacterium phosphoreum]|uniref:glycosyltransferase family 2 protein n=1 Tax=Photobacterium phosphoreum TaxID=659 RepID=UPI000D180CA0|nr:hypothetical protein [Photobacterium phosphoreum]PSU31973.1 hypothetical protein CTM85_20310 [Photobacterium phosphoreum]